MAAAKKKKRTRVELVAWSPGGERLLFVHETDAALVDPATGTPSATFDAEDEIHNYAISSRNVFLYTAGGLLHGFDVATGRRTFSIDHPRFLASVDVSADGSTLLAVSHDVDDDFGPRFVEVRDTAKGAVCGAAIVEVRSLHGLDATRRV